MSVVQYFTIKKKIHIKNIWQVSRDAGRQIWFKPQMDTNLGMA